MYYKLCIFLTLWHELTNHIVLQNICTDYNKNSKYYTKTEWYKIYDVALCQIYLNPIMVCTVEYRCNNHVP